MDNVKIIKVGGKKLARVEEFVELVGNLRLELENIADDLELMPGEFIKDRKRIDNFFLAVNGSIASLRALRFFLLKGKEKHEDPYVNVCARMEHRLKESKDLIIEAEELLEDYLESFKDNWK